MRNRPTPVSAGDADKVKSEYLSTKLPRVESPRSATSARSTDRGSGRSSAAHCSPPLGQAPAVIALGPIAPSPTPLLRRQPPCHQIRWQTQIFQPMHHVLGLLTCPIRSCHNLRDPSASRNIHDVPLASDEMHHSISHRGTRELTDTDNVARNRAPGCLYRCETPFRALDLSGSKHGGLGKYLERLRRIMLVHLRSIPNCQPVCLDLPSQFGRILGGPTPVQRDETLPRLRAIRSKGQKDHQVLTVSPTEVTGGEHLARGGETLPYERCGWLHERPRRRRPRRGMVQTGFQLKGRPRGEPQ